MTIRGAIVDLDGTVYRGGELIPGAAAGVCALRDAGVRVVFVSNNPARSPRGFAEKLRGMGVPAEPGEVVTSGTVTAEYLAAEHPDDRFFVVGEQGLVEQLLDADLALTDDTGAADALVASYDRGFEYGDLVDALRVLGRDDTRFFGTDPDRTIPSGDGGLVPGSGAIVGAIAHVVEREPDAVLGKPSEQAARAALDRVEVSASDCLVVGDRLDTDVAMGERAGATTVLVRTGVTDDRALDASAVEPDHVLDSLAGASRLLTDASARST
jgi:4-nitrophenyl phosphatase